ncbi:MAG: class I SAM-dependent methyltransferase, partial [Actinomycetota bacterium]|nr:class I SAM-dependent methyltransferase [Actinomycetota bacterium]
MGREARYGRDKGAAASGRTMARLGWIRRRFPLFAGLTRYPVMRFFLRALDLPGKVLYREFRRLPSNDLRCRVGVAGRYFGNEIQYLTKGLDLWLYLLSEQMCTFSSDIVEIGCGCGRRTHFMRDYNFHGRAYRGRYIGIDIDAELLQWCRENFDAERFQFFQATHPSTAYVNETATESWYS